MPINIGKEMALPMEQIIGGPMQAVVKAQALAASSTADFVQRIGLEAHGTAPNQTFTARTVEFSFDRTRVEADETTSTETVDVSVPLLTILPIPFIRVEMATIDFEAKVSSQTIDTSSSQFNLGVQAGARVGALMWGANLSINTSYESRSSRTDTVNRSATMTVHVKAVQDVMPSGLSRVLGILETAISDEGETTPAPAEPTPTPA